MLLAAGLAVLEYHCGPSGTCRENHRKSMGKPWENGGFSWDFMGYTRNGIIKHG